MKKVIYYYSGTGNSLQTAMTIADALDGTVLYSARNNPKEVSSKDADVIGFVCPVYEWDVPGVLKSFIKDLDINPNAYIFMVATYIAVHGRCFETVEEILSEKGAHLSYGWALRCVASQCIAYPPFPPEKLMLPYMERKTKKICKEIVARRNIAYPHMSSLTRKRYQKVMGPYMAIEHEYDKGFYTDDRCIGCSTCKRVCPNRNITMSEKRPVWNHHCHGCNACVAYCPTKAIQFKTPKAYQELGTIISKILRLPERRKRYHHPLIKASDLMKDKIDME